MLANFRVLCYYISKVMSIEKSFETKESIEPDVLGRRILRTFYLSFALSQGIVTPQVNMLGLSASRYQSIHGHRTVQEASKTIDDTALAKLQIPAKHKTITEKEYMEFEFQTRWKDFNSQLSRRNKPYDPTTRGYESRLALLASEIITADMLYLAPRNLDDDTSRPGKGRPNKKDPYKSYFREHVLGATSIGDPNALDPILSDASDLLDPDRKLHFNAKHQLRSLKNYSLPQLAYAWENCHPGEKFADPDVITEKSNLRTAQLAVDLTQ